MKKNMSLVLLFLVQFMLLSQTVFAQSQYDDCAIYQIVLEYFNHQYGKPMYVYTGEGGVIDPVDPKQDSFLREGIHRYSFFIVKKRGSFGNPEVPWFSHLMQDSSLGQYNYISKKDSLINCIFPNSIKYQYKNFEEIEFEKSDYYTEVVGTDTIQYAPFRITLSKVLYAKNIALVNAGKFTGLGMAGDTAFYGFVFKKNGKDWVLEKSEWVVE